MDIKKLSKDEVDLIGAWLENHKPYIDITELQQYVNKLKDAERNATRMGIIMALVAAAIMVMFTPHAPFFVGIFIVPVSFCIGFITSFLTLREFKADHAGHYMQLAVEFDCDWKELKRFTTPMHLIDYLYQVASQTKKCEDMFGPSARPTLTVRRHFHKVHAVGVAFGICKDSWAEFFNPPPEKIRELRTS